MQYSDTAGEGDMLLKNYIQNTLVIGLFVVSLGGFLLHIRTHPLNEAENFVPFVAGLLTVVVVTGLFLSNVATQYAYVLNGMLVILGTVTMTHYSIATMPAQKSIFSLLAKSMFPDILMLWVNFAIGKALFDLKRLRTGDEKTFTGRWFRYPSMSWWFLHLVLISTVYTLGHILWK